jgi:hypothetical protein
MGYDKSRKIVSVRTTGKPYAPAYHRGLEKRNEKNRAIGLFYYVPFWWYAGRWYAGQRKVCNGSF